MKKAAKILPFSTEGTYEFQVKARRLGTTKLSAKLKIKKN